MSLFNYPLRLLTTKSRGAAWEAQALAFLQQQNLHLVERNYRCKACEIDLIMRNHAGNLIFIEVRGRTNLAYGGAAISVTRAKQQRLLRTAAHYLWQAQSYAACRFDVIAFEGKQLMWYQDVFIDQH